MGNKLVMTYARYRGIGSCFKKVQEQFGQMFPNLDKLWSIISDIMYRNQLSFNIILVLVILFNTRLTMLTLYLCYFEYTTISYLSNRAEIFRWKFKNWWSTFFFKRPVWVLGHLRSVFSFEVFVFKFWNRVKVLLSYLT